MSLRRNRARRSAFTLIELLLVLVILAVLASIVVVNFSSVTKKNNETKAKADISNLSSALAVYQADAGDYPASLEALVTNPGNVAKWNGPYIQRGVPMDPWTHPYVYVYPGVHNANGFDLSSNGDGHSNAEGLDNWTNPSAAAH